MATKNSKGWKAPDGISLQEAYYSVIKKIEDKKWDEFTRLFLKVDDSEIDHIKSDAPKNRSEQKYMMCKSWESKQGANASVKLIYEQMNKFLFVDEWEPFISLEEERKKLAIFASKSITKYACILIATPFRGPVESLADISHIPWLRVLDFDPEVKKSYFLRTAKKAFQSLRRLTEQSENEIKALKERETNWSYLAGYNMDLKNSKVNEQQLMNHCESIVKFCGERKVPIFLILWYPPNNNDQENLLPDFMTFLRYHIRPRLKKFKCIICTEKFMDINQVGLSCDSTQEQQVTMPLENVCKWFGDQCKQDIIPIEAKQFPSFTENKDEKQKVYDINDQELKWFRTCCNVLSINGVVDENPITSDGENFLKGGLLSWFDMEGGKFDVRRDILQEAKNTIIENYIGKGVPGIIPIYHHPGGGGTTFARQLLWELKGEAPCLELLHVDNDELEEMLEVIHNEVHIPTVLLVDGIADIDLLRLSCDYHKVIILHVQRDYSSTKRKQSNQTKKGHKIITVPENVTLKESENLLRILCRVCKAPTVTQRLKRLHKGVENGNEHFIFEYGLTAFESEFHGLESYVEGNLRLTPGAEQLENWQEILGYLALADYYGHCSLPSKMFGLLLGKDGEAVSLDDIEEESGSRLIREDINGNWKISYYRVSIGILERILLRGRNSLSERREGSLSEEARKQLPQLAMQFILFMKRDGINDDNVRNTLTKIFIKRTDGETTDKSFYSRLIEDASTDEEKENILLKLVHTFDEAEEFQAHLGRFYGKTEKFEKGEKYLKSAIEIALKNQQQNNQSTLYRIYSMLGYFYKDLTWSNLNKDSLEKVKSKEAICSAKSSIEYFLKAGDQSRRGYQMSYIYMGELKVRMRVTEYANKISGGDLTSLNQRSAQLAEFAFSSFSRCDELLSSCLLSADEYEIDLWRVEKCAAQFSKCFQNSQLLSQWADKADNYTRARCKIAIIKTFKNEDHKLSSVYDSYNGCKDNLVQIINLYEECFSEAGKYKMKEPISMQIMGWLHAIRHPDIDKEYLLSEVKTKIDWWVRKNEKGSLSHYYQYVITVVLAMTTPSSDNRKGVAKYHRQQIDDLKERMTKSIVYHANPSKSLEWLGRADKPTSIRKLVNRRVLGKWNGRFWMSKDSTSKLQVCRGEISDCRIHRGIIIMDNNKESPIRIYFNPQRYGFHSSDAEQGIRVEFFVGFNLRRGAEAYEVKRLHRHICPTCKQANEISELGQDLPSTTCADCGYNVLKTDPKYD